MDFESQMQNWEQELQENKETESESEIMDAPGFSPFAEVEEYEFMVARAERGSNIVLNDPQNGFHWNENEQLFQFSNLWTEPIQLVIEDNRKNTVYSELMNGNTSELRVNLPLERMNKGRFYIKFTSGSTRVILGFVIK